MNCKTYLQNRFILLIVCVLYFPNIAKVYSENLDHQQQSQKLFQLAKRLEKFGYYNSAQHYYQILYRDPKVEKSMRDLIEKRLVALNTELNKKEKKSLPDLEDFSHFKVKNKVEKAIQDKNIASHEFPSPRINKKKWLIRTLVVAGVGFVAYRVNRHLRRKEPPTPNQVQVGF